MVWFFQDTNLFKILCPHKFKAYKKAHEFKKKKTVDVGKEREREGEGERAFFLDKERM